MPLKDFKVGTEEAESISVGKILKTGISRHTGKHQSIFFFRQEVITCYITMQLITAYGELITCLSAEPN